MVEYSPIVELCECTMEGWIQNSNKKWTITKLLYDTLLDFQFERKVSLKESAVFYYFVLESKSTKLLSLTFVPLQMALLSFSSIVFGQIDTYCVKIIFLPVNGDVSVTMFISIKLETVSHCRSSMLAES